MSSDENESKIAADNHWSGVQPVSYDISLTMVNLEARTYEYPPENDDDDDYAPSAIDYDYKMAFSGEVKMHFRVIESTDRIIMHHNASDITIKSVAVQSLCGYRVVCVSKVNLQPNGQHFVVHVTETLVPGQYYTISVQYQVL